MKKFENINDILKKIRKKITPSNKQPASIDPKKMEKVAQDVEIAKEIIKPLKDTENTDK